MSIELTLLISIISVSAAIYFGLANKKRNDTGDISREISEHTAVCIKLETISENVKDVKSNVSEMKADINKLTERLIRLEESDKSQWSILERNGRNENIQ